MSGEGTEGGTAERSDGFPSLHRARSGSFIDPDISLSVGVKCHIRRKMPAFLPSPRKCWTLCHFLSPLCFCVLLFLVLYNFKNNSVLASAMFVFQYRKSWKY